MRNWHKNDLIKSEKIAATHRKYSQEVYGYELMEPKGITSKLQYSQILGEITGELQYS